MSSVKLRRVIEKPSQDENIPNRLYFGTTLVAVVGSHRVDGRLMYDVERPPETNYVDWSFARLTWSAPADAFTDGPATHVPETFWRRRLQNSAKTVWVIGHSENGGAWLPTGEFFQVPEEAYARVQADRAEGIGYTQVFRLSLAGKSL